MSRLPTVPPAGRPLNALQTELIKLWAELAVKELLEQDPVSHEVNEEARYARD